MEARIVRVLFFMPTMTAVASDNLHLSELAPTFVQSEIRAMNVACAAAKGINMAQGVCDTDPPLPVVDAAIEAIRGGHNIYTRLEGIASLREGLAQKLATFNGLTVDPEREILVTAGATGAMYCTLLALLNPGDECLIFEPFYGYHILTLRSQRIKPVTVPLDAPDWTLDMDRLRAAVTPRTRAIILNSPGNPSGKVFTLAELELLANFAIEHDLFVFTDEMYEYFLYEGAKHISIASLPGMADRTITISGFSKTFSVTGWRLGYLTGSTKWLPAIGNFHDLTFARPRLCSTVRRPVCCSCRRASTQRWPPSTRRSAIWSAMPSRAPGSRLQCRMGLTTFWPMRRASPVRMPSRRRAGYCRISAWLRSRARRSSG
jgi:aminotransferase